MTTLATINLIDPRILRVLKKRALRKTLPMVIIFTVIMLVIHDLWVMLFWGFFFGAFWSIMYCNALYFLLNNKYPHKFPFVKHKKENNISEPLDDWDSDTINNPAFRGLSCNMYNDH